jgi:hypothetical protein
MTAIQTRTKIIFKTKRTENPNFAIRYSLSIGTGEIAGISNSGRL